MPRAPLPRRLPVTVPWLVLLVLGLGCLAPAARAQWCVDYRDYLHYLARLDVPGYGREVCVDGSIVYLCSEEAGLDLIDVSDPAHPVLVGHVDTPGEAFGVDVAASFAGLLRIDISDPTQPAHIGTANTPSSATAVALRGDHAFVADLGGGLQVVDIDMANPLSPIVVASLETESAWDIALAGDVACIADGDAGVKLVDISDPESPALIGAIDTPDLANGIEVAGTIVYVADRDGLVVLDVADPAAPATIGTMSTAPSSSFGVALAGDVVCMAAGHAGAARPGPVGERGTGGRGRWRPRLRPRRRPGSPGDRRVGAGSAGGGR